MSNIKLTWALCVSTLNRLDMLKHCVSCALSQTYLPHEIIIVDASDNWQENRAEIQALISNAIPLHYLPAPVRSLTVQRNTAIAACTADVCMLIDDDSLMHPDCAEVIMRIYEADQNGEILGLAGVAAPPPREIGSAPRKETSAGSGRGMAIRDTKIGRFLWHELFLMSRAVNFVPYAGPAGSRVPNWATDKRLDLSPAIQLPGCRMTLRRSAAIREPFEAAFRSYSPGEDFDISYRLSRIGAICIAGSARIYHHEVATSRIRREQELVLSICNVAYLIRRHSPDISRDRRRWSVLMSRRLLAELLKDFLSRRWRFPQLRAARQAAKISKDILLFSDDAQLAAHYIDVQEEILAKKK